MAVKLFILGLPGSGKSTVARSIATYIKSKGWNHIRFSDHVILQDMFLADSEHKQFKPADYGGFDVLDLSVFDIALQRLEQEVKKHILSAKSDELILIEFARNDYQKAFQQFSQDFLKDAYFLYLDTDIEKCKKRIRRRIAHPSTEDDFFVSDYIFSAYYNQDNGRDLPHFLERDYGIGRQRVVFIDNNGSLQGATAQINLFVDIICGLESI